MTGLPDFHSPVDIALQALDQVTIRNKYGAPQYLTAQQNVPAGQTATLTTVTGSGYLYGGNFEASTFSVPSAIESYLTLVVDGVTFQFDAWDDIVRLALFPPQEMQPTVTNIDDTEKTISGHLPGGITFETSLVVKYTASSDGIDGIVIRLNVATI